MPKKGILTINLENFDISTLEDALPFNEGLEVHKKGQSNVSNLIFKKFITLLAEAQIFYDLESQDYEIIISALEDNGFDIIKSEENNADDEKYETLKKQTEALFLDDDEDGNKKKVKNRF